MDIYLTLYLVTMWCPSILPSTNSFSFIEVSIGLARLVFRQFEK